MRTFVRHYIAPLARRHRWTSICEIGSRNGASADHLLNLPLTSYTIIDPCIDQDLGAKYAGDSRVQVIKSNSLDALTSTRPIGPASGFDCILDRRRPQLVHRIQRTAPHSGARAGAAWRVHLPPRCRLALWPPRLVLPARHHSGRIPSSICAKGHDPRPKRFGRIRRHEQHLWKCVCRGRAQERRPHGN